MLVPALPDRVIESVHAASDGLYVLARKGAYSQLLHVDYGTRKISEIALPFEGHADEVFTDPRKPGATIALSSWVVSPVFFSYDPKSGKFTDLHIGAKGDIDASAFIVSDLQTKAADGVMVPLSLVQPKGVATPQIAIIEAYGSYGISELADFSSRRAIAMKEGMAYGICHVPWRRRTWRGLASGWQGRQQAQHLAGHHRLWRGSHRAWCDHQGQAVHYRRLGRWHHYGRAMEERPDLFAGVLDLVPAANTTRSEFTPNGPDNIPEFGTITNEQGFKNLLAMDSVLHVRSGVTYPAVMIATGLNDPRVAPWEPAKFAASLLASGTPNPVLLRIDPEAGHGIGSTRSQTDLLMSDVLAFVKWRAGVEGWKPVFAKP